MLDNKTEHNCKAALADEGACEAPANCQILRLVPYIACQGLHVQFSVDS